MALLEVRGLQKWYGRRQVVGLKQFFQVGDTTFKLL